MKINILLITIVFFSFGCLGLFAQDDKSKTVPKEANPDDEIIKVETSIVNIPVTVFDRSGKFVPDLKKEDFRITEDGIEQKIEYFSTVEQPFTVALVLDMSPSAQFKINEIQTAAEFFVKQIRQQDRVMAVAFNKSLYLLSEPTNDREKVIKAIHNAQMDYGTSVYSAVDATLKYLNKIKGRKAIVLFTDGVDTTSKIGRNANIELAKESDVLFYVVQYDTYQPPTESEMSEGEKRFQTGNSENSDFKGSRKADYERANVYLNSLADISGGKLYQGKDLNSVTQAYSRIIAELANSYYIGYYPKDESKKGQHKLKIKVNREKVAVRAKDSYVINEPKKTP